MKIEDIYYIYDKPVPVSLLSGQEVLLYPVLMKDYIEFHAWVECLTIDKNSIADIKIISMSYLEYIFHASNDTNKLLEKLRFILSLCFRVDEIKIFFGKVKESNKPIIKVNDVIITGQDFDEIRRIICEQNLIELEDDTIQKEVRDKLREARSFKNKSGTKMASLEDQLICVLISTSLTMKRIYLLPIRKFVKILQRVDAKLHYEIYLSSSMSGFVTFKDKSFIKHWMSDLTKDKIDENLISKETVENNLSGKKI